MYNRDWKADKELEFSKPFNNSEKCPVIEPLRINKPRITDYQHIGQTTLSSKACSSEIRLPYPDGRNDFNFPLPFESPSHHATYLNESRSRSRDSSRKKQFILEAEMRPENHLRGKSMSPKLRLESDNEITNYKVQRGDLTRPFLGAHDRSFSDLCVSNMLKDQTLKPTSHNIRYLEPRRYHNYEYLPPQELDASPASSKTKVSHSTNSGVNRIDSVISISTTRASRGSPPLSPSELDSPIGSPQVKLDRFENRKIATALPRADALNNQHSFTMNEAQKFYTQGPAITSKISPPIGPLYTDSNNSRPWCSSNEYCGNSKVAGPLNMPLKGQTTQVLRQQIQQLNLSPSPPPAYSSVSSETLEDLQAESNKKKTEIIITTHSAPYQAAAASHTLTEPHYSEHPAFANEPKESMSNIRPAFQTNLGQNYSHSTDNQITCPNSHPPLPEGWISHLDPNSGQYYYIHLQTQFTQWEFPKGPTPLNYNTAQPSPGLSMFGNPHKSPVSNTFTIGPITSPSFSSLSASYKDSIQRIVSQTPTTAGFTGPPPTAGIEMYKIKPTNSVYFGPYLRYTNMDIQKGIWLGSIMLVTDALQPPTIHIHKSSDLSPNPRQLKPESIFTHQRWIFHRYNIDLEMGDTSSEKWTYAITSHLGCTRYEFLVAGRHEMNWKFIAHSGNDFTVHTSANERSRLGGFGTMWKDILQKHSESGGFHVQLGLGDQIYGDRLWKEIPLLKQWLAISGKENRKNTPWTARHEEDVSHAYFHYYTSHFDQSYLREAFAQIPHILQIDHHDIFDGFGSFPDYLQSSDVFENIGRIGIRMYLLFQHHTTLDVLRKSSGELDLFTITGNGWHFTKFLGPAVAVVGPDCRSERNQRQVLAGPTYQGLFPKVINLPRSIQHCIWMISVPVIYPRLDTVESFAQTFTTAKKGVTTTYNLLGKMTSSVAGVVGGKQAVASGFSQVKKVVGKSGLMGGVLNTFGDIDIADDLRDMWTHESRDLERTYLIRTLQSIAHQRGMRMTFLSGDVNCAGAGLVYDPSHPSNHKTIYQIISSAIVASPLPCYVLKMLHNHKTLYVPANGQKTTNAVSDTKEDMIEIFRSEANGMPREMKKLIGRRNYVIFMPFDPEDINGTNYSATNSIERQNQKLKKISIAVDFIVQDEGSTNSTSKFGPVIIPGLEHGR
ncbi:hypothetical protein HI914_01769 [Erysiphe necator]|nr:hypothetical protein HI914_01769 [Erysiphe necator]